MPEPVDCFIDFDDVRANLSEGAVVGKTKYRTRPPDTGCLHAKARTIATERGMANVLCPCGHEWMSVKVWEPPAAKLSEAVSG